MTNIAILFQFSPTIPDTVINNEIFILVYAKILKLVPIVHDILLRSR